MPAPNIPQGVINRLKASVTFPSNPSLNVTPAFLGREMIRLAPEGEITTFLPTATGAAISPEPYQMVTITINLSKAQGLAQLYENQLKSNSQLGTATVRPDSTTLGPFTISNCAIGNVEPLQFNGETIAYNVTIRGYRPLNDALWG